MQKKANRETKNGAKVFWNFIISEVSKEYFARIIRIPFLTDLARDQSLYFSKRFETCNSRRSVHMFLSTLHDGMMDSMLQTSTNLGVHDFLG